MSKKPPTHDDLYLKADLLAHGVDFSFPGIMQNLIQRNKVRSGTGLYNYHRSNQKETTSNTQILQVLGQHNVKAPNEIHFPDMEYPLIAEVRSQPESPYKVIQENDIFLLQKDGKDIVRIDFPTQLRFNHDISPYGNAYGNIVHPMGKNALRIYPDMTCLMDKPSIKCRFCGTLPKRRQDHTTGDSISDERLIEETILAVKAAQKEMPIDHIFMSTGAFYDIPKTKFYAEIIRSIRETLHNPNAEILFALTPPPINRVEQIDLLIDAGVSDLSFNLEAWDDTLWELSNTDAHLGTFKVKRGKKDHFAGYERTVRRLGLGSAKSNFVGGVENLDTLFQGFDVLLEQGVVPSITVFYPTPGAEWVEANIDPRVPAFREDAAAYLVEAYMGLAERTFKAGLKPHWAKENRISALEWDTYCHVANDGSISSRVEDKNNISSPIIETKKR